ncbi:MAG: hypothetical protein DRP56_02845, partial [Planctomycetota bacterium]
TGTRAFARTLAVEKRRQERALFTAVRVEGFRQWRNLKKEIRSSAPGGNRLAPLSFMARITKGGRLKPDKPLKRLAALARYQVQYGQDFEFRFGWDTPRVSASVRKIAKRAQEGYTVSITPAKRRALARIAGGLGPRSRARRYLFLRKSTVSAHVPARELMEPYWAAHRDEARRNIRRNFRRKMKGEYI